MPLVLGNLTREPLDAREARKARELDTEDFKQSVRYYPFSMHKKENSGYWEFDGLTSGKQMDHADPDLCPRISSLEALELSAATPPTDSLNYI